MIPQSGWLFVCATDNFDHLAVKLAYQRPCSIPVPKRPFHLIIAHPRQKLHRNKFHLSIVSFYCRVTRHFRSTDRS